MGRKRNTAWHSGWAAIVGAIGWLAASGAATDCRAQTIDATILQRPWVELRTPNFRAFTIGDTQALMSVVGRLEQFRFLYSSLAGTQTVVSVPILVFAFGDDRTFSSFKPLYEGKPKNIDGYFAQGLEANFIGLDLGSLSRGTLQTIYHEYTHLLLRHNSLYWPLWLEEGMADLYSTFEVEGGEVLVGKPPARRLRMLTTGTFLPLQQMFGVSQDSPEYNEAGHQGLFYAQSWLLTHYLAMGDNPRHRANFGRYTQLLREGMDETQAFVKAFGTTLPAMEREIKAYLARGKFEPTRLKSHVRLASRLHTYTRPLPPAETAFWLGLLLIRLDRNDEARQYFELAGRLQPREPFKEEGLGLLAADRGQAAQAVPHLEQAVKLGSQNYIVHYQLGRQRLDLAKDSDGSIGDLSAKAADDIRVPLKKAVQLMPGCAPAHNRLGFLELIQRDDLNGAEKHLETAARLEPSNCAYVLMLARLQVLRGKAAQARITLQDMVRLGSHPNCQAEARKLLSMLPEAPAKSPSKSRPKTR